jgi:hypothetical protein
MLLGTIWGCMGTIGNNLKEDLAKCMDRFKEHMYGIHGS